MKTLIHFALLPFFLLTLPGMAQAGDNAPSLLDRVFGGQQQEESEAENTPQAGPQKSPQELYLEQLQERINPQRQQPRPYSDFSEIPQEALEDMQRFYEYCEGNFVLQRHYNCECLSSNYLDERIRTGPIADYSVVLSKITTTCVDPAAAAGTAFEQCMKTGGLSYSGGEMSPEEYCECVGNNYAILVSRLVNKSMEPRVTRGLMTSAYLRCKEFPPGIVKPVQRLDIRPGEQSDAPSRLINNGDQPVATP